MHVHALQQAAVFGRYVNSGRYDGFICRERYDVSVGLSVGLVICVLLFMLHIFNFCIGVYITACMYVWLSSGVINK